MMVRSALRQKPPGTANTGWPIRIGFVPLNDCAPLVVATEQGLFTKRNLRVRLDRELGWATIRDKVAHGELDGAHAVCGLPFILRAGVRNRRCDVVTPMVLSLNGNAITLAEDLWDKGVRDATSLGRHARSLGADRRLTFGIVSRHSAHAHLLKVFLGQAGLTPDEDVDIVVVPPPQMLANLQGGHLDGFCAGEPYNSDAVARRAGWVVATSTQLAPFHPEKVLITRQQLVDERPEEHAALLGALLEACAICDDSDQREEVVRLLARREYLNIPVETLRRGWPGNFDCGHAKSVPSPDFNVFHGRNANEPSADKAAWVVKHVLPSDIRQSFPPVELGRVFRPDLYAQAIHESAIVPA
jgi:ABC-type nitrate/sulfonate/bicarbonate transport system substrate-binding protein